MDSVDPARFHADDAALVRATLAGDRNAFDRLAGPHLIPLRSHVRGALRGRPDLDVDEAVQETLVRSYQALDVFDPRYRFAQYLFGIANFVVRRQLCAKSRETPMAWVEAPEDGCDPDHLLREATEAAPAALRALAGVERFAPPDACTLDRAVFRELLMAVLDHGGYPHQQLAFAFGIVVWGKRKADRPRPAMPDRLRPEKVPVTGDPERVVRELSETSLLGLRQRFARELATRDDLEAAPFGGAFNVLDYRLELTIEELFAADIVSSRRVVGVRGRRAGDTTLADYYGADPRKSVADWIGAVKKRTFRQLTGRTDSSRSPLPWPPGHGNLPSAR